MVYSTTITTSPGLSELVHIAQPHTTVRIAGVVSHEGYTRQPHHKSSDVCITQVLPHQKSRNEYDDCCSRNGVGAGRGSPGVVLLPLSVETSTP